MGSALNHRPREHEIGAGPGLTDQIGQEGLSWAKLHGRVQTHGPTPTVMTVEGKDPMAPLPTCITLERGYMLRYKKA